MQMENTLNSPSRKNRVLDKKNLINAREQIKSKLNKLKMDKQLFHDSLKENFEPIFKPLESISKNVDQIKKERDSADYEKNNIFFKNMKQQPRLKITKKKKFKMEHKIAKKKKFVENGRKAKVRSDLSDNDNDDDDYKSAIADGYELMSDVEKDDYDEISRADKKNQHLEDYGTTAGPSNAYKSLDDHNDSEFEFKKSTFRASTPAPSQSPLSNDRVDFENESESLPVTPSVHNQVESKKKSDTTPSLSFQDDDDDDDDDRSIDNESLDSIQHSTIMPNEIVSKYIVALHKSDSNIDKVCGVRKDPKTDSLKLGNADIKFDNDKIYLGGKTYTISENLMNLLFMKAPIDPKILSEYEKTSYKQMLDDSSAHRLKHDPNKRIKKQNSNKFRINILSLFGAHEGQNIVWKKLSKNKHESLHGKSVDQLVDRLRLLYGSASSGNDSHYNEISKILRHLEKIGVIERP